jgi:DNA invertase Pin-like site-specific DNA recombinase
MDGIDTNTAAGHMVFSMVGAISEFERNVISGRTRAGMAAARRRGRHVGRPTKLAPDQLDYALRMIVEEEGRAQVARMLGVDPSTLRRLLMKSETW